MQSGANKDRGCGLNFTTMFSKVMKVGDMFLLLLNISYMEETHI